MAGTAAGAVLGWQWFGWIGLVAGSVLGFAVGSVVGNLPFAAATSYFRWSFSRYSLQQLRDSLHSDDCLAPNLFLIELHRRGEDVSAELPLLYTRLTSEHGHQRVAALAAIQTMFPDLAQTIPDYNPNLPVEECRQRAEPLQKVIHKNEPHSPADVDSTGE